MDAWSGATFDTTRDRLLVWGGGHHDYSGNEIYAFELATLRWRRLTDASTDVSGEDTNAYYLDGLPRARHTYGSLVYLPASDRFCAIGGNGLWPTGQHGENNLDCFDFSTSSWTRHGTVPDGAYGIGAITAVDPANGHVWSHGGGNSRLAEYVPASGQWTNHAPYNAGWLPYYLTGALDPVQHRLVAVGGGQAISWDLTNPNAQNIPIPTDGGGKAITYRQSRIRVRPNLASPGRVGWRIQRVHIRGCRATLE